MINKRGFTLVELLVVIVIVGILSAAAIATFTGGLKRARNAVRDKDVRVIVSSVRLMKLNEGVMPTGATELVNNAKFYFSEIPADPYSDNDLSTIGTTLPSHTTSEYTYAYYKNPTFSDGEEIMASAFFEVDAADASQYNKYNGRYKFGTMKGPQSEAAWTIGSDASTDKENAGTIVTAEK